MNHTGESYQYERIGRSVDLHASRKLFSFRVPPKPMIVRSQSTFRTQSKENVVLDRKRRRDYGVRVFVTVRLLLIVDSMSQMFPLLLPTLLPYLFVRTNMMNLHARKKSKRQCMLEVSQVSRYLNVIIRAAVPKVGPEQISTQNLAYRQPTSESGALSVGPCFLGGKVDRVSRWRWRRSGQLFP